MLVTKSVKRKSNISFLYTFQIASQSVNCSLRNYVYRLEKHDFEKNSFKVSYASFLIDGTLFLCDCFHVLYSSIFWHQYSYCLQCSDCIEYRMLCRSTLWIDYLRVHTRVHFKCYHNYFEYPLRTFCTLIARLRITF